MIMLINFHLFIHLIASFYKLRLLKYCAGVFINSIGFIFQGTSELQNS